LAMTCVKQMVFNLFMQGPPVLMKLESLNRLLYLSIPKHCIEIQQFQYWLKLEKTNKHFPWRPSCISARAETWNKFHIHYIYSVNLVVFKMCPSGFGFVSIPPTNHSIPVAYPQNQILPNVLKNHCTFLLCHQEFANSGAKYLCLPSSVITAELRTSETKLLDRTCLRVVLQLNFCY
jgi:hypothetical protein